MTAPSYMAYVIIAGVVLIALLAPLFVGAEGWVVPLAVLPFALFYALFDRTLRQREERGELGH